MAYALPEKQKAYQREWAKKKSAERRHIVEAQAEETGTVVQIGTGVITWQQLKGSCYFEKIGTWNECARLSKEYLLKRKTNRLVVAALAERACVIRHGGKAVESLTPDIRPTIADFAKQIGINKKTLYEWIRIKKLVIDKLPETTKRIDWTAASIAIDRANKHHGSILDLYDRCASPQSKVRAAYQLLMGLKNVAYNLTTHGTSGMLKDEKKEALVHYNAIKQAMDKLE